jgi:hypothetical protein
MNDDLPQLPQHVTQLIDGVWVDTVNPQVQLLPAKRGEPSYWTCEHSWCDPAYPCKGNRPPALPGVRAALTAKYSSPAERTDVADVPFVITSVSEAGYKSPFYIGPLGGIDGGAEEYWNWRKARDGFTATGEPAALEAMTRWVTSENPPLASDCLPYRDPWLSFRHAWGRPLFFVLFVTIFTLIGSGFSYHWF